MTEAHMNNRRQANARVIAINNRFSSEICDTTSSDYSSCDDDLREALLAERRRRKLLLDDAGPLCVKIAGKSSGLGINSSTYGIYQFVSAAEVPVPGDPSSTRVATAIATVIDACDESVLEFADEAYVCPNCGAPSTVGQLVAGCDWCGTRFVTADLFPRVFSFSLSLDEGMRNLRRLFHASVALGAASAASFFVMPLAATIGIDTVTAVSTVLLTLAYLALPVCVPLALVSRILMVRQPIHGASKLAADMQPIAEGFSYDYLMADVISTMRKAMFHDGEVSPVIVAPAIDFGNVVDACFTGRGRYNGLRHDGTTCTIQLELTFNVTRVLDGNVVTRNEVYAVELQRDISTLFKPSLSVRAVKCKGCGGSFNALAQRHCPYCNRPYDARQDNWIITWMRQSA